MACKKFVVTFEGVEKWNAYELSDKGWNGSACPGFELDEAIRVMDELCCMLSHYEYIKKWDVILYKSPDGEVEVWQGKEHKTEDGVKKLYAIGAWGWTWSVDQYGHLTRETA